MASPSSAPVLSTPDSHVFEEPAPQIDVGSRPRLKDDQLQVTYEIQRTIQEIRAGKWRRIALQFPDHMLPDAPRVFQALSRGLKTCQPADVACKDVVSENEKHESAIDALETDMQNASISNAQEGDQEQLYILADTSYGSCCVDEVAAEHAEADVVVHYGRSCLSPTSRLPVIYVFTQPPLDFDEVVAAFTSAFGNRNEKIILDADIPYCSHLSQLAQILHNKGYKNIFTTSVVHNVASPIPNRTVPGEAEENADVLLEYQLFHVSEPPPSLLLMLSSRLGAVHIYPTLTSQAGQHTKPLLANSAMALRRRYALLTTISSAPIIGILINTLSVRNYMNILSHVKRIISDAGKKAYTFVMGKVNAAKVANFSEVGGWVVIGCWESSLFESKDFWKPLVTPFELELALKGDQNRVWTGEWTSNFEDVLREAKAVELQTAMSSETMSTAGSPLVVEPDAHDDAREESDSEEESAPPEFDLRTGRYVSQTRPMGARTVGSAASKELTAGGAKSPGRALTKNANKHLATIGGEVSPAAEFFKSNRSWQGLGSDYQLEYDDEGRLKRAEPAPVEQGRSGIARGYAVGDGDRRT